MGLAVVEVGVEKAGWWGVDVAAGVGQGAGGAVEAVHAGVLPFDGDGAGVADLVVTEQRE